MNSLEFFKKFGSLLSKLLIILTLVTFYKKCFNGSQNAQVVYKERQSHIERVCETFHDRLENDYKTVHPKVDLLMSNTQKPFLWCRVAKASSQSWNDLFMSIW